LSNDDGNHRSSSLKFTAFVSAVNAVGVCQSAMTLGFFARISLILPSTMIFYFVTLIQEIAFCYEKVEKRQQ
jgi:hypothetical protein